ncbi:DNA translocase FtsK [Planococcus maritimus]|uniref:DNA translocase FtsK n=1 Tax=Planococcus maritimus TaxID=192421 RepID=A0A7D7MB05_PLAMR|nr:FtsK/SpoIIIE domain-containing protein [Planococcus maritimus]QMT17215.1 DNA translocase FtsK [Planococcus maritimus]
MITNKELISKWLYISIEGYLKEQKKQNNGRLFIKVSGFDDETIRNFLEQDLEGYNVFFNPIIRTILSVPGQEKYSIRSDETSIKLRNNLNYDNVLIFIINGESSGEQSLENIFEMDESYLLSDRGLKTLFEHLYNEFHFPKEDLKVLYVFFDMLRFITVPQLNAVATFMMNIINSEGYSIDRKIQENLYTLGCFNDKELSIDNKDKRRFKENYLLANMQNSKGKTLDIEKTIDKVYSFISNQIENNYDSEIWEHINGQSNDEKAENLRSVINGLVEGKAKEEALKIDFRIVREIFDFKEAKKTQEEKILELLEKEEKSEKEKLALEKEVYDVLNTDDAQQIEDFIEEYYGELAVDKKVLKDLNRRIEKLLHPSEYEDILDAILHETFSFVENNNDTKDLKMKISVKDEVSEAQNQLIDFYLLNINKIVRNLEYKSAQNFSANKEKNDVAFILEFHNEKEKLNSTNFKIMNLNKNDLLSLISSMESDNSFYIRTDNNSSTSYINLIESAQNGFGNYLEDSSSQLNTIYKKYIKFLENYTFKTHGMLEKGIYSVDIRELKEEIQELFEFLYLETSVSTNFLKNFNNIGSIDIFEDGIEKYSVPISKILTLINPIKLISYIEKTKSVNEIINKWIKFNINGDIEIQKKDEYLKYEISEISNLAPGYMANNHSTDFLILEEEYFGNGYYYNSSIGQKKIENIAREVSTEVSNVVRNYLEIYPFARDGLDILFLYTVSAEVIIESIKKLLDPKLKVKRLKIIVHSHQSALIHTDLNRWIDQNEEVSAILPNQKFPKIELKVISGDKPHVIKEEIDKHMIDKDIVVLSNYFAQNNQVNYQYVTSGMDTQGTEWFEKVLQEPIRINESIKRIPLTSIKSPDFLKSYYNIQYILHTNSMPKINEYNSLEKIITASSHSESNLIDLIHDNFEWVMILDKNLDKTLLQKSSQKAQVIQYKSKAGVSREFKLIVSSSKRILKLNTADHDTFYYDRISNKISHLLKVKEVKTETITDLISNVKNISGALILRAMGPGKFTHELLSNYLYSKNRNVRLETIEFISLCDELPWFRNNNLKTNIRPDLIDTTIFKKDGNIMIDFKIVELKFINAALISKERVDALKQVNAGEDLYKSLFDFDDSNLEIKFWREEFINYIIENKAFNEKEIEILKELQLAENAKIQVNFKKEINIYCYTSNLHEYSKLNAYGVIEEQLENNVDVKIYNRNYILNNLNIKHEIIEEQNLYPELDVKHLGKKIENEKVGDPSLIITKPQEAKNESPKKPIISPNLELNKTDYLKNTNQYPEIVAFKDIDLNRESVSENLEEVISGYARKLIRGFAAHNIPIDIKENIIGSSVIRIYIELPKSISQNKITPHLKDIIIWLGLKTEPHLSIDENGLYLDILRESPSIIYYDYFMGKVREKFNQEELKNKLIVPIGMDPLNEVVYIDLNDSITPHLLVGGTTGSGKSVTLNSIIFSLMLLYEKEEVQFIFIDPKQVEFAPYENKTHTKEVIFDIEKAIDRLEELRDEMNARYTKMVASYNKNISDYNDENPQDKMSHYVIVFDEFADFMLADKESVKRVEEAIQSIAQKGRAAGFHLIICTQNPRADIINTKIRSNLPARLSLKVTDSSASKIILNLSGAQKLAGKGDFLIAKGSDVTTRGKSPFLEPRVEKSLFRFFEI